MKMIVAVRSQSADANALHIELGEPYGLLLLSSELTLTSAESSNAGNHIIKLIKVIDEEIHLPPNTPKDLLEVIKKYKSSTANIIQH